MSISQDISGGSMRKVILKGTYYETLFLGFGVLFWVSDAATRTN